MSFTLPDLPYSYDSLEPHIDAKTMEIHHKNHHGTYVKNLNAALEAHPDLSRKSLEELLADLGSVPDDIRTAVRNNGGGHWNHSLFWSVMGPGKASRPTGVFAEKIRESFGSIEAFQDGFKKAALGRFGSGWAWLVIGANNLLSITSAPNQDSPLLEGNTRILMGLDVWEHAYYLQYQSRRADYVDHWWNVVNWEAVAERFQRAIALSPKDLRASRLAA